ncbi:hypothetical protein Hanom_Chr14g01279471 [Helianthus anomalus]
MTFIHPLVPQVAGISHTRFRRYTDYVVVSNILEGLGVAGGGAVVGGSAAGSKPADEKKKRKADAAGAGEWKCPKLRTTRTAGISQPKPTVMTDPLEETFSFFEVRSSPPRDAAVYTGVNKEFTRSHSIEAVTSPSVHVEDTGKKAVV